ncbi:MAG: NACHT domain-containing protein [Anaerolineales bacterium]|nr:NACHT domain-containing protein [Anaerolineales bacterium]
MTDLKATLRKLQENLNTLREREARYGGHAPLDLLNQIEDHQKAIALTEQAITGELTEAEWRKALRSLLVAINTRDGEANVSSVTIGDIHGSIIASEIAGRDISIGQKIVNIFTGSSEAQRDLRNRQIMLQRVHDFWIKGVLEKSLFNEVLIELGKESQDKAVEYPWEMVLQTPENLNEVLPPGKKVIEIFNEMGRALLILGEPGSGKTVTLLELARDAIACAEQDPIQPIPAVFNLSSWAEKRQSLVNWLVDELDARYQIPKKIGHVWIEQNKLLLLLDGLDEVAPAHQSACVAAINKFRQEYGLTEMVVCSRIIDYKSLDTKLMLQGAIRLLPLTPPQIEDYLTTAGSKLATLNMAFRHDAIVQELAQSPLMLSIMSLAYQDLLAIKLAGEQLDSLDSHRRHLFATYLVRMFKRRKASQPYPSLWTLSRLTWLARNMVEHNQSVLQLEDLQPSWLSSQVQRWLYLLSARCSGGVALALGLTPFFIFTAPDFWVILSFVLGILGAGAAVGLLDGLSFKRHGRLSSVHRPSRSGWWQLAGHMLLVGLSATLGFALVIFLLEKNAGFGATMLYSLPVIGIPFGLIFGTRRRWQSIRHDIRTVESLSWSWRLFLRVGVVGVILAGLIFIITSFMYRNQPFAILWDSQTGRLITPLENHSSAINTASFSPDGMRIVTASDDHTATLWNGQTGTLIATLESHTDKVNSAYFSPDGTRIVTASDDHTAILWNGQTGTLITTLKGHTDNVNSAYFSPDSTRMVTASDDHTAILWNGQTDTLIATLKGHTGAVNSASFSPDGTRIVTVPGNDEARLWDGQTGTLIATLEGANGAVNSAAFSPDDTRIVTVSSGQDYRLLSLLGMFLIILGLFNGLRSGISDTKTLPNQGIWLSARNAVLIGLGGGLIIGPIIATTFLSLILFLIQMLDLLFDSLLFF